MILPPAESEIAAIRKNNAALQSENARLRSALERTATALRLAYSQKPLRDMAETLAEADAALKGANHE